MLMFQSMLCRKLPVKGAFRVMAFQCSAFHELVEWKAPTWCHSLSNVPKRKVQLCRGDTPIHRWNLPGVPPNFEVFIKRDDLTGSTLSGNKVRKLEYIFAEALESGCKHVITCGGAQSNHCRATAAAAAQLGLKCHLLLRTEIKSVEEASNTGNLFLDHLFGTDIYFVPKTASYLKELKPRMEQLAERIKEKTGESSRLLEVGGSDDVGVFGYIDAFEEMKQQGVLEQFSDVVFACGSGGTAEGLAVGNHLNGNKLSIHGVAVCDDAQYFHGHADSILKQVGVDVPAKDILDIVEGYKGKGYGVTTEEGLDFICDVARNTGVVLDPVYTGKAAQGLIGELNNNPARFRGNKVLFIHTGGLYGAFDGTLDRKVMERQTGCYHMWTEKDSPPFP